LLCSALFRRRTQTRNPYATKVNIEAVNDARSRRAAVAGAGALNSSIGMGAGTMNSFPSSMESTLNMTGGKGASRPQSGRH
jgi:hypothetical protein